jgi:hypothetical protein
MDDKTKNDQSSKNAASNNEKEKKVSTHFLKADRSLRPEGMHFETAYDPISGHAPYPQTAK